MAYQTQDTQPERTALAWNRTSLALMGGTLWVCRKALVSGSVLAWLIIGFSTVVMFTHFYLLKVRKKKLRQSVDNAIGTGIEPLMALLQFVLVSLAALIL